MKLIKVQKFKIPKSKVKWWAIIAVLGVVLALTGCKKDCDCGDDTSEAYPILKVVNHCNDNWRYITTVGLVGYEFKNLNILVDDSQTFTLDNGMPSGYEDINVTVTYYWGGSIYRSASIKVNFANGVTTTVTLNGGGDGIYLVYNP